jgi:hypothetical protein
MNAHLRLIRQRRRLLLLQVAEQRLAFAQCLAPWRTPLTIADTVIGVAGSVARHPLILVLGSVLLWRVTRGRLLRWGSRLVGAWKLYTLWRGQLEGRDR